MKEYFLKTQRLGFSTWEAEDLSEAVGQSGGNEIHHQGWEAAGGGNP